MASTTQKSFIARLTEPYVHGVSMKGLKAATAVLPFNWPKTFEGESPAVDMCQYIVDKGWHKSLLFISSKTPVRTGLIQPMVDVLEAGGIKVTVYDDVKPDPTVEQIEATVKVLVENNCDGVIALGGGSVIDAAKAVAARGKNPKRSILDMTGMFRVMRGMLPLYAVPTTAGTGSEVTIAAVVTDTKAQKKLPMLDPRLMPRLAALDGGLMLGVPKHVTAATGMDALTHAVEAYISGNAMDRTDVLALEAVKLIMANLETAVEDGNNLDARQAMARASHLAGKAFTQAGVGYVHAIAHNFGALYHVPHGRANAIVMPYVLDYSKPRCAKRLARLAREAGIGDEVMSAEQRADLFIARIREMNKKFDIPDYIEDLKEEDIPRIAQAARAEARWTYAVPRYMRRHTAEWMVSQMLPDAPNTPQPDEPDTEEKAAA